MANDNNDGHSALPPPKRRFTGYWIPVEAVDDPNLRPVEKLLLAEIKALEGEDGCYAGNEHLAKHVGMTAGAVANSLTRLRKLGYIQTLRFDGRNRWLRVVWKDSDFIQGLSLPSSQDESSLHHRMKVNISISSKEKYPLPPELADLESEWQAWLTYKRERRNAMTPTTYVRQIAKLQRLGAARAKLALQHSMENGWSGLYEPKADTTTRLELGGLSYGRLIEMSHERRTKLSTLSRNYGENAPGAVGKQKKQLMAELAQLKDAIATTRNNSK